MISSFEDWKIQGLFGAPSVLFDSVDSTHLEMKRRYQDLIDGTVIVANSQIAGRGRHFRQWVSPAEKNLYFNILLPLHGIPLKNAPQLMQVAALSIAEFLNDSGISGIFVKWPNDIWHRKEKLGGVIAEILPSPVERKLSLGIGLNVNVSVSDLSGIDKPATSLSILSGKILDREKLLIDILKKLEQAFKEFRNSGILPWLEKWRKMACFVGSSASIVEGKTSITGKILGIENDGSLLFETESGVRRIYSGDLEI